jgi:hypothetical protein
VPEVAEPRKHHSDILFITRIDDFLIAFGAARLNHRSNTALGRSINAIPEREEGI